MSGSVFYAVEMSVGRGFLDPIGEADPIYLAAPSLALSEFETGFATTSTLYASDAGYRRLASDTGGPIPYPPLVQEAFSVDVAANLDPTKSNIAAAWGTLTLANTDHRYDPFISGWQTDGQPVKILRGVKTLESFDGMKTARGTVATHLAGSGILITDAIGTPRNADFVGDLATLLKGTTNYVRNNTNVGAVVAGALPTQWWSYTNVPGGTVTVAALGTESGLPYVDLTFAGTVTVANQLMGVVWENVSRVAIAALTGQVWTSTIYYRLISGSFPTGVILSQFVEEDTAAGAALVVASNSPTLPNGSALITQQYLYSRTLSGGATTAAMLPYNQFKFPNLGAFSFTLRIAGAQAEVGFPGGTNYLPNTTMVGTTTGTIGAGAVVPSGWGQSGLGGVTVTLVGTGVESGLNYIDFSFVGTPSGTGQYAFALDAVAVFAITGQAWTLGGYMRLTAGALTNVTSGVLNYQLNSNTQFVAGSLAPTGSGLATQPVSIGFQSAAGTTFVQGFFTFGYTAGNALNFTVRLGGVSLERSASQGPWNATSGTPLTVGGANYIRNATNVGVVAGSIQALGRLPTNWSYFTGASLVVTVIGSGTEGGLPYVEVSIVGTPNATGYLAWQLDNVPIPTSTGQTWTLSAYLRLTAGAMTNAVTSLQINGVTQFPNVAVVPTGAALNTQPNALTMTTAAADTQIIPYFIFSFTNGLAVNTTLRIGGVMLDQQPRLTPFIATLGSAAVINAAAPASVLVPTANAITSSQPTYTVTGTPQVLNEAAATNYILTSANPSATNITTSSVADVPAVLSGAVIWKHLRTGGADSNSGFEGTSVPSGSTVCGSVWLWLPSYLGTKSSITVGIESSGQSGAVVGNADLTKKDQWQRVACSAVLNVGVIAPSVVIRITTLATGDTFYSSCWQIELGTVATSYIPSQATAAVRAADYLYPPRSIFVDPAYASLTPVFTGVLGPMAPDENVIRLALRDASYYLERPLALPTYQGTGGLEGTPDMQGVSKPILWGGSSASGTYLLNVPLTPVDPANLVYQYMLDDPLTSSAVAAVYDGGAALTFGAYVYNIYASVPAAGRYNYDARGNIRLGSTPVFQPTADVGTNTLNPDTVNEVVAELLGDVSLNPTSYTLGVPSTMVNSSGGFITGYFPGLDNTPLVAAMVNSHVGLYIAAGQSINGIAIMDALLASTGCLLIPARDGRLALMVLAVVPTGTVSQLTFDASNIVDIKPLALPAAIDPPPWRLRLAYGHNWTVQTTLAGSITPAKAAFVGAPNRLATAVAVPVATIVSPRKTDPDPIGAGGCSTDATSGPAQAVVSNMVKLWGSRRRYFEVTVPASVGLALDWTSVVTIISDYDNMGSGVQGQIVGWHYASGDATASFRVLV